MLTSKKIAALKPRAKRFQITDQFGLALRVQTSGVKSWVLRVPQNGRIVDITIGHWPEISLMHARAIARQKRKELELEPSSSFTVRDAFRFWCSKKRGRISSYRDEKIRLEKYVISKIGSHQTITNITEGESFSSLRMDARRSSAVYGAANTVQPNSLRALVLVRAY